MSSVTELISALQDVQRRLEEAHRYTANARGLLGQTRDLLARADPNHPDLVVPAELSTADDQIERTQQQLAAVIDDLGAVATRL